MRFRLINHLLGFSAGVAILLVTAGCQTPQVIDPPQTQPVTTQQTIDIEPDPKALDGLPDTVVKDLEPLKPYILWQGVHAYLGVLIPVPSGFQDYHYSMKDLISGEVVEIQWQPVLMNRVSDEVRAMFFKRTFGELSSSIFEIETLTRNPRMNMLLEHTYKDKVITHFDPPMMTRPLSRKVGEVSVQEMEVTVRDEKTNEIKHTGKMTQRIVFRGWYKMKLIDGVYDVALISASIDGKVGPATIKNRYHGFHHAERGLMAEVAFEEVSAFLLYNDKTHRVLLFNGEIKE